MTRHRLHVKTITSIGAVYKGDNDDESKILFWKRAPLEASRRSASGDPRPVSGADRGRAQGREIIRRIEKTDEKIADLADGYRTLGNKIESMKGIPVSQEMTAETIAESVVKRAAALRSDPRFWDRSDAELRTDLWKRTPGLRDAYTAAMRDPDGFAKSREHSDVMRTVRDWNDSRVSGPS